MTCVTTPQAIAPATFGKLVFTFVALWFAFSSNVWNSLLADEPAVVLIIRTGALHSAELSPADAVTPNLRTLVRGGSCVASSFDDEVEGADGKSDAGDPAQRILNLVLPQTTLTKLNAENVSAVIIDPDRKVKRAGEPTTIKAGPRTLSAAQALAGLELHVGKPKPISPEEAATRTALRKILGLRGAASTGDSPSGTATETAKSDSESEDARRGDFVATRVRSSLKKGARLVIVLDRVSSKTTEAVKRRDAFLDAHRRAVTTREGATLALLSFSSDAPASGLLVLWGPKIRSGWIVSRSVAVNELGTTLLWLIGKQPKSKRLLIDDLLLD